MNLVSKELILCHKLWFSNPYIFETQCLKPLIFQTYVIWSNRSQSLKYQRFTTLESKDIGIRKSNLLKIAQKKQFMAIIFDSFTLIIFTWRQCFQSWELLCWTSITLIAWFRYPQRTLLNITHSFIPYSKLYIYN